jgi:hypothetical protein
MTKNEELKALHPAVTVEPNWPAANGAEEAGHRRYRVLATMVQGTAATLPEAWRPYGSVEEARGSAREMLHNHRVLRVAIVEDRIPPQFVEWVSR